MNIHGIDGIKALQTSGTDTPLNRGKRIEGHEFALIVAHVPLGDVGLLAARVRITLDVDLLNTAAVHKVIDITGTESNA